MAHNSDFKGLIIQVINSELLTLINIMKYRFLYLQEDPFHLLTRVNIHLDDKIKVYFSLNHRFNLI